MFARNILLYSLPFYVFMKVVNKFNSIITYTYLYSPPKTLLLFNEANDDNNDNDNIDHDNDNVVGFFVFDIDIFCTCTHPVLLFLLMISKLYFF